MVRDDRAAITPSAFDLFCTDRYERPETDWAELERRFFLSVRLPNGTYKTTSHHRLDDLNALLGPYLPKDRALSVMDVAVSSGISTVEWLEALERQGVHCQMIAGDLTATGYILSAGGGRRVLVNAAGDPMQYEVAGNVVRTDAGRRQRLHYALSIWRLKRLSRSFAGTSQRLGGEWPEGQARRVQGFEVHPVRLLSRQLRRFSNLQVIDDDILTDRHFEAQVDVLRAANIVNLAYFDTQTLTAMLLNLRGRLRGQGLLVVCRTLDSGVNHGTIFRLEQNGAFSVLARLHAGSEVEALVLGLPPAPSAPGHHATAAQRA